MTMRRIIPVVAGVALLALAAWAVSRGLERLVATDTPAEQSVPAPSPPPSGVPRITATLFYASSDGQWLVPVRQEVALAEGAVLQGRVILTAQLQGAPAGYSSVVPQGTTLRAFYVTDRGDAFVDLSADVSSKHPGGTFAELLTVHAIVNSVAANLPTVKRVQILIDGRETDTLAGHIDLRRPLQRDLALVREEGVGGNDRNGKAQAQ